MFISNKAENITLRGSLHFSLHKHINCESRETIETAKIRTAKPNSWEKMSQENYAPINHSAINTFSFN